MKVSNIDERLNEISTDENVGVKLARLTGDETTSIFAIELSQNQVIPVHYHKEGIETYFILAGEGMVRIRDIARNSLAWQTEQLVKTGDCFTIYPNEVHEFKNVSKTALRIIATAPTSHSKEDRHFIERQNAQ